MTIARLAESTHTLYSELLDQAPGFSPDSALGIVRIEGDRRYDVLVRAARRCGPATPDRSRRRISGVARQIRRAEEARALLADDERRRRELVSMLAAGGLATESSAIGSVLAVLADSGLFHAGAVLIGTQAFRSIANILGVRFDLQNLRTADVDVGPPRITIGVREMRTDILEDLRATDPRFVAVPKLDARQPSTSFKVRGRDLRVDLLTPGSRESARPVLLPNLNAAALPLPGLEYLLTGATQAVVISRAGVLVNVPSPARFAVHKLWVAQRRNVSEHAKARKDIRQAGQILEVLLDDRRSDVDEAFGALTPSMVKLVRRSCATLDDSLRKRLP